MKTWIGAGLVAMMALATGSPEALAATKGVPQGQAATRDSADVSVRRANRRYPVYRTYARSADEPTYYARPYWYRPYPYAVPAPFFLGFAYLPRW